MNYYNIISCVISALGVIVSAVSALFTYKNLKEIRTQFWEQNRGNLVFYIDKIKSGNSHSLILKNYGNSPAKLLTLEINPPLDNEKSKISLPTEFNICNCKNVLLAPKQFISSEFFFEDYPDKVFQIKLVYETCGKTLTETYCIDLHYANYLVETRVKPNTELNALKEINQSIQRLSDRFL